MQRQEGTFSIDPEQKDEGANIKKLVFQNGEDKASLTVLNTTTEESSTIVSSKTSIEEQHIAVETIMRISEKEQTGDPMPICSSLGTAQTTDTTNTRRAAEQVFTGPLDLDKAPGGGRLIFKTTDGETTVTGLQTRPQEKKPPVVFNLKEKNERKAAIAKTKMIIQQEKAKRTAEKAARRTDTQSDQSPIRQAGPQAPAMLNISGLMSSYVPGLFRARAVPPEDQKINFSSTIMLSSGYLLIMVAHYLKSERPDLFLSPKQREFSSHPMIKNLINAKKLSFEQIMGLWPCHFDRILAAQPFILTGQMFVEVAKTLNENECANLKEKRIRDYVFLGYLTLEKARGLTETERQAILSDESCTIDDGPAKNMRIA